MRNIALLMCTLLVTLFVRCTHDDIDTTGIINDSESIYAYVAEDESRVELNSNTKTVWSSGDEIIVLGDNQLERWRFTGKTGDRHGEFKKVTVYSNWGDIFNGELYAVYPFNEGFMIGSIGNTLVYLADVKSEQEYHKGSYDPSSNLMFGTSENGRDYYFKNLLGYLRLSLTGNGTIKSIKLKGNNDEVISGTRYFSFEDMSYSNWYTNTSKVITLNCPEGVKLSDTPTHFYFTISPISFEKGINIDIELDNGQTIPKLTSKRLNISRNSILPMSNIELNSDINWQYATVTYRDTESIVAPTLYGNDSSVTGYIYWGDDTYSVVNSTSSYVYIDGNDKHTVTVKVADAVAIEFSDCSNIYDLDFTNF